jgi:hypothetical protein
MGGGVVGGHEGMVRLLERRGSGGQGELVIIQTPLNVEVGFHPIEIAFTFGAFNGLMADLQPGQHRLEGRGGERPATV